MNQKVCVCLFKDEEKGSSRPGWHLKRKGDIDPTYVWMKMYVFRLSKDDGKYKIGLVDIWVKKKT